MKTSLQVLDKCTPQSKINKTEPIISANPLPKSTHYKLVATYKLIFSRQTLKFANHKSDRKKLFPIKTECSR